MATAWLPLQAEGLTIHPALAIRNTDAADPFEQMLASEIPADFDASFQPADIEIPNLGIQSHPIWVRFSLNQGLPDTLFLSVELPSIDRIDLFAKDGTRLLHRSAGRLLPSHLRDTEDRFYTFRLPYRADTENVYYLRVQSDIGISLPIVVRDDDHYRTHLLHDTLLQGFYFGWISVMVLYNLFLFATTKSKGHLYYALTLISSNLLLQLSLTGYLTLYLNQNNPLWARGLHNYLYMASIFFSLVLPMHLLATRRFFPAIHIMLRCGLILCGLTFLASLFISFRIINQIVDSLAVLSIFMCFITGYFGFRSKYRPAMFFFIGFGITLLSGGVVIIQMKGYLPTNFMTQNSFQIAQTLEVLLIGFAVADRYNIIKRNAKRLRSRNHRQEKDLQSIQNELVLAGQLQGRLFPTRLPDNVTVRNLQSSVVGGDLYDCSISERGNLSIILADVAGHGLSASLEAAMLLVAYRQAQSGTPAQKLHSIHNILSSILPNLFITAIIIEIDKQQNTMTCASAGHPHCLILSTKSEFIVTPPLRGKPIGVGHTWAETTVHLNDDDRILLFTDGLTEAVNHDSNDAFGNDRLYEAFRKTSGMQLHQAADKLLNSFVLYARGQSDDDATFLLIDPFDL